MTAFPALKAARDELSSIFNEAGGDTGQIDLMKVKSLDGKTQAERAQYVKELNARVGELEAVYKAALAGGNSEPGASQIPPGTGSFGNATVDAAKRTLEHGFKAFGMDPAAASIVEALLKQDSDTEVSAAAEWISATGSDEYVKAFYKLAKDPARGHMLWTEPERKAYERTKAIQGRLKAGSLTGNSEMLPLYLDPTVNLTSAGSINPLRDVARVVQTTSNSWNGVTSAGITAEWKAENAEAADAAPGTDPAPIPVHFGDAFVPYSFELEMDGAPYWVRECAKLLSDAALQLTATAYTTGDGTGKPTGIITALAGGASVVAPTTVETFAAADVFKVQNALPARFQPNATWQANLSIINTIRQFETTNGAMKFPELTDGALLNRRLFENSNMDGVINPLATEANNVLLYGDFSNFVIVDRIGTTVELVPHLTGANGRPTGQRGMLMWFRTGSDSVVDNAFRMLNVATTA